MVLSCVSDLDSMRMRTGRRVGRWGTESPRLNHYQAPFQCPFESKSIRRERESAVTRIERALADASDLGDERQQTLFGGL